jgi:hypothetical protein
MPEKIGMPPSVLVVAVGFRVSDVLFSDPISVPKGRAVKGV